MLVAWHPEDAKKELFFIDEKQYKVRTKTDLFNI